MCSVYHKAHSPLCEAVMQNVTEGQISYTCWSELLKQCTIDVPAGFTVLIVILEAFMWWFISPWRTQPPSYRWTLYLPWCHACMATETKFSSYVGLWGTEVGRTFSQFTPHITASKCNGVCRNKRRTNPEVKGVETSSSKLALLLWIDDYELEHLVPESYSGMELKL